MGIRHSQNDEQDIIEKYFGDYRGQFLDIGANDGMILSNTYALSLKGWDGVLVEPSPKAFEKLLDLYYDIPERMWAFNVAIGGFTGEAEFYESGEHLGKHDVGLLSTLKKEEVSKWSGTKNKFEKERAIVWTFDELKKQVSEQGRINQYDFISIDCEGMDLEVLRQINLAEVRCVCICVEHNSNKEIARQIREYCADFGLTMGIGYNAENIILAKP